MHCPIWITLMIASMVFKPPRSSLEKSQHYLTFKYFKLIALQKFFKETKELKFLKGIVATTISLITRGAEIYRITIAISELSTFFWVLEIWDISHRVSHFGWYMVIFSAASLVSCCFSLAENACNKLLVYFRNTSPNTDFYAIGLLQTSYSIL